MLANTFRNRVSPAALLCAFLVLLVGFTSVSLIPEVRAGDAPNLDGIWQTPDGDTVRVDQAGDTVNSTFLSDPSCPWGDARSYYIQGTLQGLTLSGTMDRCTNLQYFVTECGLSSVFETPFTATVTDGEISGTRRSEYYDVSTDDSGKHTCTRDPSGDEDVPFLMTRVPDTPTPTPTDESQANTTPGPTTTPRASLTIQKLGIRHSIRDHESETTVLGVGETGSFFVRYTLTPGGDTPTGTVTIRKAGKTLRTMRLRPDFAHPSEVHATGKVSGRKNTGRLRARFVLQSGDAVAAGTLTFTLRRMTVTVSWSRWRFR
ncbi:MAG TPA: hypothetical protein VFA78_09775 [Chloroflexota bacterium]|nr:hypothetical protein [Chloroflexota bacterium]